MDAVLLEMLRCPATRQKLVPAPPDLLARLSGWGAEPLEAALVRADGTAVYPIRNGIPVLTMEAAISLVAR